MRQQGVNAAERLLAAIMDFSTHLAAIMNFYNASGARGRGNAEKSMMAAGQIAGTI